MKYIAIKAMVCFLTHSFHSNANLSVFIRLYFSMYIYTISEYYDWVNRKMLSIDLILIFRILE